VDAARFDLREVRQQARKQLVRGTHEAPRSGEQVSVGELSETGRKHHWIGADAKICFHALIVHP
jgi:hypothetical protein